MGREQSEDSSNKLHAARFATTHWTMIHRAGRRSSPDADRALESLCQAYWYPLYAYARRRGATAEAAQDSTQEFFARLLEKELLRAADREKGRFRTFLLTLFQRFLANQYQRSQAIKRGGGLRRLSFDFRTAEDRYQIEPADDWTPERIYERRWALTVLERVVNALEEEFQEKGQCELFEHCRQYLTGSAGGPGYEQTAVDLGMTAATLRVAVHRMRRRYRELLKAEVAQTVDGAESVEDEIRGLHAALRGGKN